jgi:hypothetical protein
MSKKQRTQTSHVIKKQNVGTEFETELSKL